MLLDVSALSISLTLKASIADSTDGLYAGPWGVVSNSFVMVNDDSLKPMARHTKVRDCTVW